MARSQPAPAASAPARNRALGQRLAQFRKQRGFSQEELARRVGAVQVVISDYERGKLRLSAEMALRFAAALDVPIQTLLLPSAPVTIAAAPPRPSRRLLGRLERIQQLPRRQQAALLTTIDAFLKAAKAS